MSLIFCLFFSHFGTIAVMSSGLFFLKSFQLIMVLSCEWYNSFCCGFSWSFSHFV